MKRIILWVASIAIAVSIAGCNTFRGMGQDIERAGEGIQNSTNK